MVISRSFASAVVAWQAAKAKETGFDKLDQEARVTVVLGLGAILLLGMILVAFVWVFGRATRRYMTSARRASHGKRGPDQDDWANKPIDRGP